MNILDEIINNYARRARDPRERPNLPTEEQLLERRTKDPIEPPLDPNAVRGSTIFDWIKEQAPSPVVQEPSTLDPNAARLPFGLYIPTHKYGNITDFAPYMDNPEDFGAYFSQMLDRIGGTISQQKINDYAANPISAYYDFREGNGSHTNNGPTTEQKQAVFAEHMANKAAREAAIIPPAPNPNVGADRTNIAPVLQPASTDMSPVETPNLLNVMKYNLANRSGRSSTRPSLQHRSFAAPAKTTINFGGSRNAY